MNKLPDTKPPVASSYAKAGAGPTEPARNASLSGSQPRGVSGTSSTRPDDLSRSGATGANDVSSRRARPTSSVSRERSGGFGRDPVVVQSKWSKEDLASLKKVRKYLDDIN